VLQPQALWQALPWPSRATRRAGVDRLERAPKPGPGASAHRWDRLALASILLGAVVRAVWGLVIHPPLDFVYSDMAAYVERAQRLAEGGGLQRADAFYPPGTHIFLAVPMELIGTGSAGLWAGAALWWALSCLVPLFAWLLARLLLTPAAAALSAAFCAFWPLYITYGAYFTSEIPSLTFMIAALWAGYLAAGQRSGKLALGFGLLAGALGGAAIACRPQWILNLAVLAIPLALRYRHQAYALAGITLATTAILGGVVVHNSFAAGKPTGLSENGGLNFWVGHCDVYDVKLFDPRTNTSFTFRNSVRAQLGRGGTYYFEGRLAWDQSFLYGMGLECIGRDGLGHARLLARNVLDMTATTTPWPQVGEEGQRGVVQASNLAYSLLLPWILIESIFLIRRRAAGWKSGEAVMLAHLACVVLVAVVFFGDPRIRSSYDVFGLALLATLIADRFGLDDAAPDSERNGSGG
jgi:4-amino-4-deoxy-L-arabinose transferase-like glycosyltransferase